MSSNLSDPRYNYWHQFMLESLKPEKFAEVTQKAWWLAAVSGALLIAAGAFEGGLRTFFLWGGTVWGVVVPVVLGVTLHFYGHFIKEAIKMGKGIRFALIYFFCVKDTYVPL